MGRKSRAPRLQTEALENRIVLAADVMSLLGAETRAAEKVAVTDVRQVAPPAAGALVGDFDADGSVDAKDIDALSAAIRGGSTESVFDLSADGSVDMNDMDMLIVDILDTNYGDANLDHVVDVTDLGSWQEHAFQRGTGWESGDFNGDGLTDVSDFNVWNTVRTESIEQLKVRPGKNQQSVEPELDVAEDKDVLPATGQPEVLSLIELPGDLNGDATVDAADIDMLTEALRIGSEDPMFDLDSDGVVSENDTSYLVVDLLTTDFGDANLDGIVSEVDFEIWRAHEFQTETGWASGDFNGDGITDVSDFNVWNSHRSAGVETVSIAMYGDLNLDGAVNAGDIDFIHAAIRVGLNDEILDLDGNGTVDMSDSALLLADVFGTFYGDANLDGVVDQADREVWQDHNFQMATGWATGDFNGDGLTDVSDFNIWNAHRARIVG